MTPAATALRVLLADTNTPGSIDFVDSSDLLLASYDNDLVALAVDSISSMKITPNNHHNSSSLTRAPPAVLAGNAHIPPTVSEPQTNDSIATPSRTPDPVIYDPTRQASYVDPFSFVNDDDLELYEDSDLQDYRDGIWEVISSIKDPEFNQTLHDLGVVRERGVELYRDRFGMLLNLCLYV